MASGGRKKLVAAAAMLVLLAAAALAEPDTMLAPAATGFVEQASSAPAPAAPLFITVGDELFSLGDIFPNLPIEDLGAKVVACIKRMASKCALKLSLRTCLKDALLECGVKAA